jgi:transcriptional regulator with XRE-family HTH domain
MTALQLLRERVEARRALPPPRLRRALRQSAGISLETLAESLGVSRETVRLWETGAHEPYERNLAAYVEALEILAGGNGAPSGPDDLRREPDPIEVGSDEVERLADLASETLEERGR